MTLTQRPNVGDVIRRIAEDADEVTQGREYRIINIDYDGDAEFVDDNGNTNYLGSYDFANYSLVTQFEEDPGYFEIHTELSPNRDDDELFAIEVTVDIKAYEHLQKLEEQHGKAAKAQIIRKQIRELEEQLKQL